MCLVALHADVGVRVYVKWHSEGSAFWYFFSYTSQWNLLFLALGVKIAIKKIATVDIIFLATVLLPILN